MLKFVNLIVDYVNGYYRLANLTREDLSKECFEGIPVQKNWSNNNPSQDNKVTDNYIQFLSVLSPFLAREFLTFLVYSLARYDSFFSTGPTECFLFVPVSNYKLMLCQPSRSLKHYTSFTIHANSLFDYSEIDLYSTSLKGVERMKIENKVHTVISSDFFSYTNERPFKTKENFVFIRIKPKPMVNKLDAEFLINYV